MIILTGNNVCTVDRDRIKDFADCAPIEGNPASVWVTQITWHTNQTIFTGNISLPFKNRSQVWSEVILHSQRRNIRDQSAPQSVNPSLNFLLSTRGETGLKQQSPQVEPPPQHTHTHFHNGGGEKWREIFYSSPKQSLRALWPSLHVMDSFKGSHKNDLKKTSQ